MELGNLLTAAPPSYGHEECNAEVTMSTCQGMAQQSEYRYRITSRLLG